MDALIGIISTLSPVVLFGLILWALLGGKPLVPKRKQFNCDGCGKLIGEDPPFVDQAEGKRVDFCSSECRDGFQARS